MRLGGSQGLGIGLAVALLAGCGRQGVGIVPGGSVITQGGAAAAWIAPKAPGEDFVSTGSAVQSSVHKKSGSWMLPEAQHETLIYATSSHEVLVYSYPNGKHVGTIKQPNAYYGLLCSDNSGNVYMPVQLGPYGHYGFYIEKYAHASVEPSVTLEDPVNRPYGCSVDPTTQNLAVNELQTFLVFPDGQAPPTVYENNYISGITDVAYDDSGNLFLHGRFESQFYIFELPSTSSQLVGINVGSEWFPYGGSLQWDGQDLAVGNVLEECRGHRCRHVYGQSQIYRIAISGDTGTIVQKVALGHQRKPNQNAPFWLYDQTVIQPSFKSNETHLGIWSYPSGGRLKNIAVREHFGAYAVTVSIAPSRR